MAVFAIGREIDGITGTLKRRFQLLAQRRFVFHDQDAHLASLLPMVMVNL